jgi:hypothetical protein
VTHVKSHLQGHTAPLTFVFIDPDELAQIFDAIISEGGHVILADAINGDDAVLGHHLDADLLEPVLILSEHFGDAGDGEDAGDRSHGQAAALAGSAD